MTNFSTFSFSAGVVGAVEQMLLGHGQHAAGAAGGVVDGDVPVGDGNVQQLDHEPDDFARGEVLSGLLAALFREAPQQLLVDVAHLQRRRAGPGQASSSLYWFRIGASRLFFTIMPMVAR